MSRAVLSVLAVGAALSAATCFVFPTAAPHGASSASHATGYVNSAGMPSPAPEPAAWRPLALGAAFGLLLAVAGVRPALAVDLENGEAVFTGNCTACHAGGNNSIVAEKKLKKDALEKYLTGGYNVQAIMTQVTNGKGSMPAFGEKLGPDDIEDVANYVFNQADKW